MSGAPDVNAPRHYPRFDPKGDGGLIDRQKPKSITERRRLAAAGQTRWVTRRPDGETVEAPQPTGWPLPGWSTLFAPARPSRSAILDWLIELGGDAEREGILECLSTQLKNHPPAEHAKQVVENFNDVISDLRLLQNAYGTDCPALGEIELPEGAFVNVDAARRVLQRLRSRLSEEIGTAEKADSGTLPTAPLDPFADLRRFASQQLKGLERVVIEAVCEAKGKLSIADLAVKEGVSWENPKKGFEDAQKRLNPKLMRIHWRLSRRDSAATLVRMNPPKTRENAGD